MTSFFGTLGRNFRAQMMKEDGSEVPRRSPDSSYLTSFENSADRDRLTTSFKKRFPRRKPSGHKTSHENSQPVRPNQIVLDHNKNVLVQHSNFNDKNLILPGAVSQKFRTSGTLGTFQSFSQSNEVQLKNYKFLRTLGKGTFAKVRLAEHVPTGHLVAIKVICKALLSPTDLSKIAREIQIMKRLNHPNIVRLYEVIEDSKLINIAMEYVAKGEIYDYIVSRRRLSENDVRFKFKQLLSAVEYCHSKNIVHRDLKAENLLLDENYCIKICDFGFSNFFDNIHPLDTFCGSPPYAAPELFRGDTYTGPEVDVWSLGVILYTLLTGSLPFSGNTLPELKRDVLKGTYRVPNYVPVGAELFLKKFLKLVPAERITLQQALKDPWIKYDPSGSSIQKHSSCEHLINKMVIEKMVSLGMREKDIMESIDNNNYDSFHGTYRILCNFYEEDNCKESFRRTVDRSSTRSEFQSTGGLPSVAPAYLPQRTSSTRIKSHQNVNEFSPSYVFPASSHPSKNYKKKMQAGGNRLRRQTTAVNQFIQPLVSTKNMVQVKLIRRHSCVSEQLPYITHKINNQESSEKNEKQIISPKPHPVAIVTNHKLSKKSEEAANGVLNIKSCNTSELPEKPKNGIFKRIPSITLQPWSNISEKIEINFKRRASLKDKNYTPKNEGLSLVSHSLGPDVLPPQSSKVNNGSQINLRADQVTGSNTIQKPNDISLKQRFISFFRPK